MPAETSELIAPQAGLTVLDRVHQAMILFAAGRGEALKQFLVEEGIGKDARFWKLAQSLSAPILPESTRNAGLTACSLGRRAWGSRLPPQDHAPRGHPHIAGRSRLLTAEASRTHPASRASNRSSEDPPEKPRNPCLSAASRFRHSSPGASCDRAHRASGPLTRSSAMGVGPGENLICGQGW